MSIKDFFIKKILQSKLKGLPQEQQDLILKVITEHPELFKKIADEVKVKTKAGQSEQAAMMQVMRTHQAELQQIMTKAQTGGKGISMQASQRKGKRRSA